MPDPDRRTRRRPQVPWWVRISVSLVVLAVLIWRVILPELHDGRAAFVSLESVSFAAIALAVVLELASLVVFSLLTRAVLGPDHPSYPTLLRIDLAVLAVNHVVPGGGATSAGLRYRLLVTHGTPSPRALSAAAIQSVGVNLVLGGLFLLGLVLSVTAVVGNLFYAGAAAAVLVLLVVAGLVVWLLIRHAPTLIRGARALARRLPWVSDGAAESLVVTAATQVRLLLTDPRRVGVVVVLGAANWLLDAGALWVVLAAFGAQVSLGALLTVYGVGSILAMLPITPGGLGVVEGVMVSSLIGFDTAASVALLGVLGWRLLEFWLPIPLGALAYASLRLSGAGSSAPPPPAPLSSAR